MKPKSMFLMLLLMIMGVVGVKAETVTVSLNPLTNGSFSSNATLSGYYTTWTSNAASGVEGLTITTSGNLGMSQQNVSSYGGNLLAFKTTTVNTKEDIVITAPSGYTITGYTIKYHLMTGRGSDGYSFYNSQGSPTAAIIANGNTAQETTVSENSLSATSLTLGLADTKGTSANYLPIKSLIITLNDETITAGKIYTINNTNSYRGALTYDPTQSTQWIWSSGKTGATAFNANSVNCQWILYPTGDEGQYYLYNVGAQKFAMVRSDGNYGNTWAFSPSAVPVTLEPQSDGRYFIKSATGNIYMSVSNNYTGPIITYYANGDGGLPFTITKVADTSSEITAQVTAAVNKLIHNTTKLFSAPITDGWYAIKIQSRDGQTGYTNDFLYSFVTEYYNGGNTTYYPLGHTSLAKLRPSMADATYFFHIIPNGSNFQWQMPNGKYLKKNDSGKFPTSTADASDITIGFENNYTYFYNGTYADAYDNFVGETGTMGRTKYDVYPINLTTAGLTAWKVIITGGSADTQLTCTRSDISGLTSVYNNGYFFLPTGEKPLNSEFTLEGMVSCTIDTDAKTITAQYDPSIGITADGVVVTQGYQTTGQGNENALLLRMDVTPLKNITNTTLTVTLDATAQQNISSLYVYETTATEFIANIPSTKLATADDISGTVSINLGDVSSGLHHYWLCATVKDDATLGDILDAALTSITYTTTEDKTLDVSEIGNPTRQGMKVFAQQNFVFKPTTDDCRYYRIPAMILDKNGNVVVAIDRRYNSNADLGSHKIDVSVVRSTNAGKTWSNQNIVAVGNTSIEERYGYGDAALARTQSGKLICLMAPGQNNFFGTNHNGSTHYNNWVAMLTSDDNGVTWQGTSDNPTQPILLTNDVFGMGTDHSIFVSSGKGLTTADGTVMFTTNVRMPDGTLNCYILKTTDEGESWTLVPEVAYSGTDESKLEQLSDGRLILSVRQSGNRGWNFGDSDGTGWGTQYKSEDIWGNACNADIINYGREMNLGKDVLIHSYINTGGRESLQLAISINGGRSWTGVYNIQPNGSCYSTMQVLSDGSLAILYEDESYSAGNGYAINYVTITKDQVEAWIQELDQADYDFDANFDKTFIIKNYNAANGNKQYIRSAKYNDANDLNVYRTTDLEESAEMVILKDHQNEGFYYVYDVKSNYYLKGSANTNAGTAWTFSTTPVTVKLTDHTSSHNRSLTDGHIFIIQNSEGSMANAYEGIYGNQVKNWTDDTDAGSHWYIYATDNSSTSSVYIDPTALYYVKNVDNGCCFETGEEGNLTRNTQATAATYAIIPVSGQTGKFYLYDTKAKNFVVSEETTGNGGQWTRSTTSPTPIPIRNNITNQYMNRSQWNPSGIIYLLGSKYANRYGGGITGLVKNYDAQSDKGSHWYLERVDNSTPAIVEMNGITDNVGSLVESGVTDGTKLQYTAKLNTVGETSWATQYLPFDLTLPENTSAYYVSEITNNTANLVELRSGIPALTPVVIKSNGATSVSFPITMGLSSFDETNLLKGTLVSMSLDLSNETTNYSLGVVNGNVGFYKYKNNGSSTITLGANKAYLQIPVPSSNSVRGFKFAFAGDESFVSEDGGFVDGINEVQAIEDNVIYDLNGLRVNTLRKGIYVVNGKKVVVK